MSIFNLFTVPCYDAYIAKAIKIIINEVQSILLFNSMLYKNDVANNT